MPDVQMTCIHKQPRQNPHEGITHLGGTGWRWTRQEVIALIEAKTHTFYTLVVGQRANIGVENDPNGKYLRTYADGQWNDNLLALPECQPSDVQVACINKQPRQDPHEGITHLGGANWRWTRQQVIDAIEVRTYTFYTLVAGKRAGIGVVHGPLGKYLRTYADGQWNDNLLALPECPLK